MENSSNRFLVSGYSRRSNTHNLGDSRYSERVSSRAFARPATATRRVSFQVNLAPTQRSFIPSKWRDFHKKNATLSRTILQLTQWIIYEACFRKLKKIYGLRVTSRLDQLYQGAASGLLSALQGEDAAYNLRSRMHDGNMASDLARLVERLQKTKGNFRYDEYRLLVCLVIQRPPDIEVQSVEKWNFEIWTAVFSLIDNILQTTPPVSISPSFDSTPVKSTSSSQIGSEQKRELVNSRIFEEICDCTFRDIEGFFDKYFEEKNWSSKADAICQRILASDSDGNWAQFPDPPTQDNVLTWWFRLQEDLLSESCGIYYTTAEHQVDLLLRARDESLSQNKHNWRDILVIGELKKSKNEIKTKATLLQISRCVREVFAAQPTRRFIHAFNVCGTKMEAWVFDRSGPYSSGIVDVYTDSKRFFQVLVGYTMMSDEELGLDTFIARDEDGNKSITVKKPENSEEKKVRLGEMLSCQFAIVCRGTTCFLANDGQGVAKFSWVSDKRQSQVELLKLAGQKNVQGVARIIGHGAITSITDMRCSLTFNNKRHDFKSSPFSRASSIHQSQALTEACHLDIRQKSSSRKCRYPDKGVQSTHKPSLFDRNGEELYDNRVLHCLVISPAGRLIYDYRSPLELLTALRDAIKAHRSLYLDGNILHRDISENNIIITDPDKADGHSGMLIDLDLAKEVGSGRSSARHRTGTMEFMAIEVLLNIDHTYRHDLESFFYVLIWQCARHGWDKLKRLRALYQLHGWLGDSMLEIWYAGSHEKIANAKQGNIGAGGFERILTVEFSPPNNSLLTKWYTDTYREIARIKRSDMGADGFEDILSEFPPIFEYAKPLCRAIRDILFPYGGRGVIVGTPQDPNRLYDPIIKAYDDAISLIGCQSD
ncbi:hypothetical protein PAAG_03671 [Paracoccidioides lutzii Pb01]|uniref:EKC/KEOPS complex subunit BUD32 n=1 Tax=Paracoccidioides lutzii (strain ATCC MYA-826 / Pb01) TaxID=502779 RepID=C1GYS7_PARBA|nr:hypothetical protein PAAG_03671 [Paracoccidioides lutzii Pb01]EEH41750.2 hypothetical protein PAAG_03671 [Paracoccidioides lutzii Pb01]